MALILIGASIYLIASFMTDIDNKIKIPQVDIFYEYSGIHPDLYKQYIENKRLYTNTKEREYMINAINSIEELALYADMDIRDEIHEKILKQESLFI